MRWGRLGLFTSFTAAAAGALLVAALTTSMTADAQSRLDASSADADARAVSTCTFTARGALTSSGQCKTNVNARPGTDAAKAMLWLDVQGASPEVSSIFLYLGFRGAPEGAIVYAPARGDSLPWFGRADVKATTGEEWVALVGIQGKFDLNLTTVRPIRVDGGTSYVLHGDLEIDLPGSNVNTVLTLHVTF